MDWTSLSVNVIAALTVPLTVLVLWGFKVVWDEIPAKWLPVLAPIIGTVLDAAYAYLTGTTFLNPVVSAAAGALAVWVHQIITQFLKGTRPANTGRRLRF